MAFYQILYWQKIPSQIKVWDEFDEIKVELSSKSIIKIDQAAREQNLIDEDSYLSQWNWGEEMEKEGTIDEVAKSVKDELEKEL